ncbi:MAG: hypothetical protein CMJ69_19755, partial [Planctomycetaceae bacterium]|nr:hypothetical protein [Planctomycetaceae bacterium]
MAIVIRLELASNDPAPDGGRRNNRDQLQGTQEQPEQPDEDAAGTVLLRLRQCQPGSRSSRWF